VRGGVDGEVSRVGAKERMNSMCWNDFLGLISILGDICVIAITIYMFYLEFLSQRIRVTSIEHNFSNGGEWISLIIKNYTKRVITFHKIDLVFNDKIQMNIKEWSEPQMLESNCAIKIATDPYSSLGKYNMTELLWNRKEYVVIYTDEGIRTTKRGKRVNEQKLKEMECITPVRNKINGVIIPDKAKYCMLYRENDSISKPRVVFIFENGVINDNLVGFFPNTGLLGIFSAIPEDIASDYDKANNHFVSVLHPVGATFSLHKISDFYNKDKIINNFVDES
jgi:hypothetical protein